MIKSIKNAKAEKKVIRATNVENIGLNEVNKKCKRKYEWNSKERMSALDAGMMQNNFKGNKKLF